MNKKPLYTGIYRMPGGIIIDITGEQGKVNPLVYIEKTGKWDRSPIPIRYNLEKATRLTAEDLILEKIQKITPVEEEPKAPSVDRCAKEETSGGK